MCRKFDTKLKSNTEIKSCSVRNGYSEAGRLKWAGHEFTEGRGLSYHPSFKKAGKDLWSSSVEVHERNDSSLSKQNSACASTQKGVRSCSKMFLNMCLAKTKVVSHCLILPGFRNTGLASRENCMKAIWLHHQFLLLKRITFKPPIFFGIANQAEKGNNIICMNSTNCAWWSESQTGIIQIPGRPMGSFHPKCALGQVQH